MIDRRLQARLIRNRESGFGVWNPAHLYINDSGICYCGRHMGVESTYMPHAWSDLGETAFVVHGAVLIRCEDPRCAPLKRKGN